MTQPDNPSGAGAAAKNGAPQLPDAVPAGVQDLLNGIFGGIGAVGRGFGDAVAALADAIGGSGTEAAMSATGYALDVAGVAA